MPELPEVEVVRRGVQRWATDGEITGVDVLDPRSLRRHHNGPEDFSGQLIGQQLAAGQRRGNLLAEAGPEHYHEQLDPRWAALANFASENASDETSSDNS